LACCCSTNGGAWGCGCQTSTYCSSPPTGTVCH
jgi:hypothetical protein